MRQLAQLESLKFVSYSMSGNSARAYALRHLHGMTQLKELHYDYRGPLPYEAAESIGSLIGLLSLRLLRDFDRDMPADCYIPFGALSELRSLTLRGAIIDRSSPFFSCVAASLPLLEELDLDMSNGGYTDEQIMALCAGATATTTTTTTTVGATSSRPLPMLRRLTITCGLISETALLAVEAVILMSSWYHGLTEHVAGSVHVGF